MNFRLVILLASFLVLWQVVALGSSKIDSLKIILKTTEEDSLKTDVLLEMAWETRRVDPAQSIDYCFKAREIAAKQNNTSQILKSLNFIGSVMRYANSFSEALDYFLIAEQLAIENKNYLEEGFANVNMGYAYLLLKDYESAEKRLLRGANLAEDIEALLLKDYAYSYLTMLYVEMRNFEQALMWGNKAEDVIVRRGNAERLAMLYLDFGSIYFEQKEYEKSISTIKKANEVAKNIPMQIGKANAKMAGIYFELEQYSLSHDYALKTFEDISMIKTSGFKEIERIQLNIELCETLTAIYRLRGNFEQLSYYQDLMLNLKDALIKNKSTQQVMNENLHLRLNAKENEYLKLELESREQERVLESRKIYEIIAIAFLGFLLVSIYFINRERRKFKALSKVLEVQKAELKDVNATKEKFFSIVAHDLKNPFHALLGLVEIMQADLKSGNKDHFETLLDYISKSVNAGYTLLDNLLSWSQSQQGEIIFEPKQTNFNELVNGVVKLMSANAQEKTIEFNLNLSPRERVFVDENMIHTVLRNLISNAIKFSHNGSVIEIKTMEIEGFLKVSVIDSGMGIPQMIIDKLFEINENISTKGTSGEKGTGIGLPLCKEFIEKHKGQIGVKSEVGKGSEFWFNVKFDS